MNREKDAVRFYSLLDRLEEKIDGKRTLADCSGRMNWPQRGAYFFFENGEMRSDTGDGLRVVRVGIHALADGSGTTLWGRLSQYRGVMRTGGGNHRGSIFRLLVGAGLAEKDKGACLSTWGDGNAAERAIREPSRITSGE